MIKIENRKIIRKWKNETIVIEAWGKDSIRVRCRVNGEVLDSHAALLEPEQTEVEAEITESGATLKNGRIEASMDNEGRIRFFNSKTGEPLLEEVGPMIEGPMCHYPGRYFRHIGGDHYQTRLEFISDPLERLYGLGQQPHGLLDQKGTSIDLYHHNSVFTVPFIVSSRKYGFFWHDPSIGKAELGKNRTVWSSASSQQIDYWVTTGESMMDIVQRFVEVTGKSPMMPEWAAGYWQCKLRYKTQEELLAVAREHKKRGLPMDVIIIDFFHWREMGDWSFDPKDWPDPKAMVKELTELGIRLMVSIWPTVSTRSSSFAEMEQQGMLVRNEHGVSSVQRFMIKGVANEHIDDTEYERVPLRDYMGFYDSTNPEARAYLWKKLKENYYQYGIKSFWLDCNEPEIKHLDYHHLRYHLGNGEEVTSLYPNCHAQNIYDGLSAEGETEIVTLSRSGWAGIQRYGTVLWSGDIVASFDELKRQVVAGLNVAVSGIPWWNTDIGGFIVSKNQRDTEEYRELLLRWFQYGAFSPVFRMHGTRSPNEVWTYGEEAYHIMKQYLFLRESMKPYILKQMRLAHETGIPMMRPLFLDYEHDSHCFDISDQYMFGPDMMVAPILEAESRFRNVYLPEGVEWINVWTQERTPGGVWSRVDAPLEIIPVFVRDETLVNLFYSGVN